MRRRDTDDKRSNDDQALAVVRHRSPFFRFFSRRVCSIRGHCDKTMHSGGNPGSEQRLIMDVSDLPHHRRRRDTLNSFSLQPGCPPLC